MDIGKQNSSYTTQVEDYAEVSPNVVVFLSSVGLILMLMNGLVICCGILYRAKLNNAFSMHILSLSVSDFIVGFAVIPMMMTFKMAGADIGPCIACFVLYLATQCASFCHILGICLHRLFTVMFKTAPGPARSSHKKVAACIAITWLICPAVASIPFAVLAQTEREFEQCSLNAIFGDQYGKAIGAIGGILLAPLLLTDGCYALFICYLQQLRRRVDPTDTSELTHTARITLADGSERGSSKTEEDRLPNNDDDDASARPPSKPSAKEPPTSGDGKGQRDAANTDCPVASTSTGQTELTKPSLNSPKTRLTVNSGQESKRPPFFVPTANTCTSTAGRLPRTATRQSPAQTTAIKTIGVLLLVLNVCSLPLLTSFLVESLVEEIRLSRNAKFLQLSLMLLNVGLNPVVYTVKMRTFRKCLVDMLKKFTRRIRSALECCLP